MAGVRGVKRMCPKEIGRQKCGFAQQIHYPADKPTPSNSPRCRRGHSIGDVYATRVVDSAWAYSFARGVTREQRGDPPRATSTAPRQATAAEAQRALETFHRDAKKAEKLRPRLGSGAEGTSHHAAEPLALPARGDGFWVGPPSPWLALYEQAAPLGQGSPTRPTRAHRRWPRGDGGSIARGQEGGRCRHSRSSHWPIPFL